MSNLLGVSDGFALFGNDAGLTVVVNLNNLDVFDPVPKLSVDFSRWGAPDEADVPTEAIELADSALSTASRVEGTDILIAAAGPDKRSFAIPKAAQAEAQKALAWRKEHHRGGTDVGLNTARTLAKGGSIGIQKVRHITRALSRMLQTWNELTALDAVSLSRTTSPTVLPAEMLAVMLTPNVRSVGDPTQGGDAEGLQRGSATTASANDAQQRGDSVAQTIQTGNPLRSSANGSAKQPEGTSNLSTGSVPSGTTGSEVNTGSQPTPTTAWKQSKVVDAGSVSVKGTSGADSLSITTSERERFADFFARRATSLSDSSSTTEQFWSELSSISPRLAAQLAELRIAWALWGGDPARRWAENIVQREKDLAILSALDFAAEEPEVEVEVETEDVSDETSFSTAQPHEYVPDAMHGYACEVCGNDEMATMHVASVESEGEERTVAEPEQFFTAEAGDDLYLAIDLGENGVPDKVTGVFAHGANDTWFMWSSQQRAWRPAPMPSDAAPVDRDGAYAAAVLQERTGQLAVPASEIDPAEWDLALAALSEMDEPVEMSLDDIEFSVRMDTDAGTISDVLMHDLSGVCWRWDADSLEWSALSSDHVERLLVDAATAREAAMRLSSGRDAEAFNFGFSRAAWIGGSELAGANDGVYTPEERSKNASQQLRDSKGRFTSQGSIVHINGTNRTGEVISVNPEQQTVRVRYSDGKVQDIKVSDVVRLGDKATGTTGKKFDPSQILAEPRAVATTPKAMLPNLLPPMDAAAIEKVINDYQAFIEEERKRGVKAFAALTPETTDVAPLYLAQVDELDKQAVVDLFALVPKTKTTNDVLLYTRKEGGWVRDDKMLGKLRSTAPPPIVTLDAATYKTVVEQVDSYYKEKGSEEESDSADAVTSSLAAKLAERVQLWDDNGALIPVFEAASLVAAGVPGVADTPGDIAAARRLRNYWLRGRGAAKIRWNTPGDWTRCVRHLTKYMGPRAKGYCQNLHKSATGVYTGSKYNVGKKRRLSAPTIVLSTVDDIRDDTKFLALLEVDIASVSDLASLTTRAAGHHLHIGERFLVHGGDGVYAVEVLEPSSVIGWESDPAVLVGGEQYATLLQESVA